MAEGIISTIVLELTHQTAKGHNESFAGALTRNQGPTILPAARAVRRLTNILTVQKPETPAPSLNAGSGRQGAKQALLATLLAE